MTYVGFAVAVVVAIPVLLWIGLMVADWRTDNYWRKRLEDEGKAK